MTETVDFGWLCWPIDAGADTQVRPASVIVFHPRWQSGWRARLLRAVWAPVPGRRLVPSWAGGISARGLTVGVLAFLAGLLLWGLKLRGDVVLTLPLTAAVAVAGGVPGVLRWLTGGRVRHLPCDAVTDLVRSGRAGASDVLWQRATSPSEWRRDAPVR